jgi:hypothetical protein
MIRRLIALLHRFDRQIVASFTEPRFPTIRPV